MEIFDELNLPGDPQLPQAKANLRTDKRHYRDILDTRQKIKLNKFFVKKLNGATINFDQQNA